MATKKIAIEEDACNGHRSLMELAGILTQKEAKIITNNIKETNEKISKRVYKFSNLMR